MHCFLWFIRITSEKLCASHVIQLVVSKIRRLQSLQGGEGQPLCSKVQLCPTDFRASTPAVIPGRILRSYKSFFPAFLFHCSLKQKVWLTLQRRPVQFQQALHTTSPSRQYMRSSQKSLKGPVPLISTH